MVGLVPAPRTWSGAGEAGGGSGGGWLFPSKSSPAGCHLLSITTLPASVAALQPTHVLRLLAKELNLFASPEFKQVHKLLVHSLIPQCGLTQLSPLHGFTGCALGDSSAGWSCRSLSAVTPSCAASFWYPGWLEGFFLHVQQSSELFPTSSLYPTLTRAPTLPLTHLRLSQAFHCLKVWLSSSNLQSPLQSVSALPPLLPPNDTGELSQTWWCTPVV